MGSNAFFPRHLHVGDLHLSLSAGAVLKTTPPYRAGPASPRLDDSTEISRAQALDKAGCVCMAKHVLHSLSHAAESLTVAF